MINILEGIRDLKAPLGSGLTLLFGFWLIFADEISAIEPGDSLAGNLHRLEDYLGLPGTLALVAFAGYVLGAVLSLHAPVLALTKRFNDSFGLSRFHRITTGRSSRLYWFVTNEIHRALGRGVTIREIYDSLTYAGTWNRPPYFDTDNNKNIDRVIGQIMAEIRLNERVLATQLLSVREKVFERYDRADSEAKFQASLVIPILCVGAVLITRLVTEGSALLAVVVGVAVLVIGASLSLRAASRRSEAAEIIIDAIVIGDIKIRGFVNVRSIYDRKVLGDGRPDGPGKPSDGKRQIWFRRWRVRLRRMFLRFH